MPIVDATRPITAQRCRQALEQLARAYPFCRLTQLGSTVFQRPLLALTIGSGDRTVLYTAAHHANEWLTSYLLLQFAQELSQALVAGTTLYGRDARQLAEQTTICLVPMVDPDGVDLVTGALEPASAQFGLAQRLSRDYPGIPFPLGWKANLLGVDLNLNYPAQWSTARQIKFAQGYTTPGPRDYVGLSPLNQLETQALAAYTDALRPALVLAFHSQGREIYWRFGDEPVPGAEALGREFARVSGYRLADAPESSAYAGYKDWFIQQYRRPGYTIEVGQGQNPLPLSQFSQIYAEILGILVIAAAGLQENS